MWTANADEDIHCTECAHVIPSGAACLSQAPPGLPKSRSRSEYGNYCVECVDCDVDASPCYVRWLDHHHDHAETQEAAACASCGDAIPAGTLTAVQTVFDWPALDPRRGRDPAAGPVAATTESISGPVTAAVAATIKPGPAGWHSLSPDLQRRFMYGGLGRGLKPRSPGMAQRLYEKAVPPSIQRTGESAVRDFINGKHFSHVKSVANSPSRARAPSNVILEDAGKNLARGSQNMTSAEREAARLAARASTIKTGARAAAIGAAKAGLVAAVAEAAVSIPENVLHYRRGRKSRRRATKEAATSTATAGVIGIAIAAGAKTSAMAWVALPGPFGAPLLIGGGALALGSAVLRIAKAARSDLDEYRIFFCNHERCMSRFARHVAMAARDIGPRSRRTGQTVDRVASTSCQYGLPDSLGGGGHFYLVDA